MKKYKTLCVLAAVAALLSFSCSKENSSIEPQNPKEAKTIQINISGEFSDFATTKGSVESIFRMKWAENDAVYVYGTSDGSTIANLGTLTATIVDGSDNRVADLSGEITAPTSGTKLTLVYSPLFSSAPEVSSNAITQSLATQNGGASDVTFIAYATVDYGGETTSTYRTSFEFATSVLRVNVSGMDKSKSLTSATITGIETACKLTISTSAEPTIEGVYAKNNETNITSITRKFSSVSTNAKGYVAFYVALPVITSNTGRSLSIAETESHTYLYPKFGTGQVTTGGNMLNTIAAIPTPVKYTENSIDLGYGTFIPETGVIWAPVNCGYEPTTATSKGYPYGKLYQWGRKDGQGYDSSDATYPSGDNLVQSQVSDLTTLGADKFYWGSNNWYSGSSPAPDDLWGATKTSYDPCPTGWRVPTFEELNVLIVYKSSWTTNTVGGVSQNGYWFSGSTAYSESGPRVFLPAAGYRGDSDGNVSNRGGYGYYWSSTVYATNYAMRLYFSSSHASMGYSERASGFSVRCVQE